MSFFFGSSPKTEQVGILSQPKQDLLDQLIRNVMAGTGGFGFDEDFFQRSFVDPAMRQFTQRTAPSIQQKFIGAGAARGSNIQDALTRAGADVEGQLAQQRAQLLNQALDRQLAGAKLALGTQDIALQQTPGEEGFASFALPIAGAIGGGLIGGPAGAQIGAGAGRAGSVGLRGFRR